MNADPKSLLFDLETLHRCARENPEHMEPYRRLSRGLLDLFAADQRHRAALQAIADHEPWDTGVWACGGCIECSDLAKAAIAQDSPA